ncbi:unnamed protein product, partial [Ilex paraguariensis]
TEMKTTPPAPRFGPLSSLFSIFSFNSKTSFTSYTLAGRNRAFSAFSSSHSFSASKSYFFNLTFPNASPSSPAVNLISPNEKLDSGREEACFQFFFLVDMAMSSSEPTRENFALTTREGRTRITTGITVRSGPISNQKRF